MNTNNISADNDNGLYTVPDPHAPGRGEFLLAAAAIAAGDREAFTDVVTDLSLRHAAGWQSVLLAGAAEHVALTIAAHHGDLHAAVESLERQAFDAADQARGVEQRPQVS